MNKHAFIPLVSIFAYASTINPASSQSHSMLKTPAPLPGPERAKAAADRVRPALERALTAKDLHFGDPVFLRAFKEEKQLELWMRRRDSGKYELFRTWNIAAQSGKPGPKLAEGDGQVPEGFYSVPPSAMKPDSKYHLAFNIGYPNAYDLHHGRNGSLIMIHGNRVSIGCLAMTDAVIEEIYTLCDAAHDQGQKSFQVHILPFRMTAARMEKEAANPWSAFWNELRGAYDHFEKNKVPPHVSVTKGVYQFSDSRR
jgi:murein L,D-transpeptidase YafK